MSLTSDINTTSTALSNIKSAIIAKGVTPSGNITTYANAISQIPTGTTPTGTLSITQNGTYNVTNYASANVNVSGGGGGGSTGPVLRGNYLVLSNGMVSPIGYETGEVDPDGNPICNSLPFNATTYDELDGGQLPYCLIEEEGTDNHFIWYDLITARDEGLATVEYYSLAAITAIDFESVEFCCDGASVIDFSGVTTVLSSDGSGLAAAFHGESTTNSCDIYFNSLNINSFKFEEGRCDAFAYFLSNRNSTSPATIHFPSNLQTLVSALTEYPTFGAATGMGICAFDLPATGSITTTTLSFSTAGVPVIDSYTIDGNTYTSSASVVLENNVPYTLSAICHGNRFIVNSTLMSYIPSGNEPWSHSCKVITDGTKVTFYGNAYSPYPLQVTVSTPIVMTSETTSNCCIPYYTKVNYFDGTTKSAEEVKISDKLLGYNENTNRFEEVEVLHVIHKIRNQLVTVTTENHEIEITPDHPILTDEGWAVYDLNADNYNTVEKIQLTENLKVLTLDGYEQIVSISYRELDEAIDMYTFDVTDPIDTYVAAGIISHNEKC